MDIFNPNFNNFKKKYILSRPQLLYTALSADLYTPVSTLIKFQKEKYIFLFESVEKGNHRGRYSAIGIKPDLIWECKNNESFLKQVSENKICSVIKNKFSPIQSLKKLFKKNKFKIPEYLPPMSSGLFGYLGYEMISHFEEINFKNKDILKLPDSIFIRPSLMLIFDNIKDNLFIIKTVWPEKRFSPKQKFNSSIKEINWVLSKLKQSIKFKNFKKPNSVSEQKHLYKNVKSNVNFAEFKRNVIKAKEYIFAGDIFQVVLSRYFRKRINTSSVSIYRALRYLNPSPYLFYIKFDNFSIVGSSPEILVRLKEKIVTIRPIAGTRKRGKNASEDIKIEKDLLSDPKEISEHLMLLDLGRNDTSKVCNPGTVKVTDKMYVEYFSHVMHIVSNIKGEIKKKSDNVDALFSGFPAGTVSGAPKIRALEIIEELENTKRNIYAGGIGYLSADGNLDSCIALRTAVITNKHIYIQAGAGIVADSDPKSEFKETENKALAILQATNYAKYFED